MKLYNRTKCPDAIIEALIRIAGRTVGARTGGVVITVTQDRQSNICGGKAFHSSSVRRGGRWIRTDGGDVAVTFPRVWAQTDMIATAFRRMEPSSR
jgi:hypothetical protein